MQKLIYGLLGVLAVGFLWLCGNAISSNLAYDNWIKGLEIRMPRLLSLNMPTISVHSVPRFFHISLIL